MPKLQNITEADIKAIIDASEDILHSMHDATNRMEKGYCDDLASPVRLAKDFALIARAASDLMVHIIGKSAMQEQKAEYERLLAERAKLEKRP